MIDPRIKNAAIIAGLLVVFLPIVSRVWSGWMEKTQQDMIDNQIQMHAHARGFAQSAHEAESEIVVRQRCEPDLLAEPCAGLQPISKVEDCIDELSMRGCDALPEINYCAIVGQIRDCGDPFEDQKRNGCDRMRRRANCEAVPAPKDRTGIWRIRLG